MTTTAAEMKFRTCDGKKCGAKSFYFVSVSGVEMAYCGHHANRFEVGLLAAADAPPVDLRYLIAP